MSLVFAGICSHAPGITGRAEMAAAELREPLYAAFGKMQQQLAAARPDALIIIAAEHFANFFMNNMPSFAIGMSDQYQGPIEDPELAADCAHVAFRAMPRFPGCSSRRSCRRWMWPTPRNGNSITASWCPCTS